MKFQLLYLPDGRAAALPDDLVLRLPGHSEVATQRQHLLAYIPWHTRYLGRVPRRYQSFFQLVMPHLQARTTNVHTATCLPLLGELIGSTAEPVDSQVAYPALILHDTGWSRVSEAEIADSLDYRGLAHSGEEAAVAREAKSKHDRLGEQIVREVAASHGDALELSPIQWEYIATIVRNHTCGRQYLVDGVVPVELRLVHDADRLWSYSYENFWQDTVRKRVEPEAYLFNLAVAAEGYFLTQGARAIARRLWLERQGEVAQLAMWRSRDTSAVVKGRVLAHNTEPPSLLT